MKLNVLYACDNNYAPFAGVSICSLLENNKELEVINVYLLSDRVSEENIQKLYRQVNCYGDGRTLKIIDANYYVLYLRERNAIEYRGGYAASLRLFFDEYIENDVEKLLYLDCDTIIVGNLKPLLMLDMGTKCVAVVTESLAGKYKKIIGFDAKTPYFNSGMILFNVKMWEEKKYKETIMGYIENKNMRFANPDQDYLNLLLKNDLILLSPKYNFQPFHLVYSDKLYFANYYTEDYYSEDELIEARENPVILHIYRFLGQFPWHKNSLHPCKTLYQSYLKKSEWAGEKDTENKKRIYVLERLAFCILPKRLFLLLFSKLWLMYFVYQNRKLLK